MLEADAGARISRYRTHVTVRGGGGGDLTNGDIAWIAVVGSIGFLLILAAIGVPIYYCMRKRARTQRAIRAGSVIYPPAAAAPNDAPNNAAAAPPYALGGPPAGPPYNVQPGAMPYANPLMPGQGPYVYGQPQLPAADTAQVPTQYGNGYGSGVYYQRRADDEAAVTPMRASSTLSENKREDSGYSYDF